MNIIQFFVIFETPKDHPTITESGLVFIRETRPVHRSSRPTNFHKIHNIRTRIYRTKCPATIKTEKLERTYPNIHSTFQILGDVGLYYWNGWIQLFILSCFESMPSVTS